MNKTIKFFLLAAALSAAFALSAATHEGEGKERLTTQTDKLSVRLLLDDWRNGFAQKEFEPGLERMKREMLKDPQHNLSPAQARKNAEAWFRDELRARYSAEVEKILRPFANSLSPQEIEKFRAGENVFFEQRFRSLFDRGFAKVRRELVEEQRAQVFQKIYPTAEELESMSDQQLTKLLLERFHKGLSVPLWEENAPLVRREVVEPAIRSGRNQQKLQLTLLQRETVPASFWEEAAVSDYLAKELNRILAKQIPNQAERYALFPKTQKQLKTKAERLPFERVIAALPRELPFDHYLQLLRKEPAKHREFSESVKIVASDFLQNMLETTFQRTGAPKSLYQKIMDDPAVKKTVGQRFSELSNQLKKVRREFAGEQLKQSWPALVNGEWTPEMTETEAYAESGAKTIPELKSRPKTDSFIRETEEKMEQLVRKAFAREIQRLEAQRKCVDQVYDRVLAAMRKQHESMAQGTSWIESLFSNRDITLPDIIKMYREEVISKSSTPLFPSIEKEIEVRARAILQQVVTPVPKKEDPDTPETTEKPEVTEVTFTLTLSGQGDKLKLSFDDWTYAFQTQKFTASIVEKDIRFRMAQAQQDGPATFRILLVVNGNKIYYSDVIRIREELKSAFSEIGIEDSMQK